MLGVGRREKPLVVLDLLALNVVAPSRLAHEALPHLRETSGTIIDLSSTYGHRPMAGGAHYAATKAAVEQLTRGGRWSSPPRASASTRSRPGRPGPT
ncbi:SDR family oxidoreductase [Streptomyces sp. NPDC086777]|uniref:SDR family oxidoreductase n=1 Tax=Streptomyces sp. NPDC086777 TaxID=3154866 RepID=UPI003450CA3B